MEPYYAAERVTMYLGDCVEVMRQLPEASVDAVVCDPPYGLEFMGKDWDSFKATGSSSRLHSPKDEGSEFTNESGHMFDNTKALPRFPTAGQPFQAWCEAWAREAYRVLKPGGHLAAFGGTRTYHRLACGIEDAGFEIRDTLAWMYGSGFPKSLDVSKAIDKAAGATREVIGVYESPEHTTGWKSQNNRHVTIAGDSFEDGQPRPITAPATEDAQRWQGWGTALKPAYEPITLARKPFPGTVAANVLAHGTGALNIDASRIGNDGGRTNHTRSDGANRDRWEGNTSTGEVTEHGGRWPANVILDEEAAAMLDAAVGDLAANNARNNKAAINVGEGGYNGGWGQPERPGGFGDRGGPSRFFYTAKASRSEREAGLDDLPPELRTDGREPGGPGGKNPRLRVSERHNDHPTVKPIAVMRWLVWLVTPPGGLILDPFLGSGTTALAALDEGFRIIGIDMTERYMEIARYRVTHRHVLEEPQSVSGSADREQGRLF